MSVFWRYLNFFITDCRIGGRKLPCQNQLDSSIRFDTIPACDRRADTDRHRATATGPSTALA